MRLQSLHRRLVVLMCGTALTAFAAGAGVEAVSAGLAYLALVVAFFWDPPAAVSERIGRVGLPLALLLAARVALHALALGGDVVVPVVDLLLLLLCSEALRSTEHFNEVRLYALTLALLLAATAYRPGAVFGLSFALYVALASVAVPMGVLRRKAQRFGDPVPAPDRALVLPTLALSSVTLLAAVVVFLSFPRVARGWGNRGDVMASSIAGFADRISIGEVGSRIYSNPQVVLRVEFPEGLPDDFLSLRWRGRSYDRFSGTLWTRSEAVRPSSARRDWYRDRWQGPLIQQEIYAAALDVRVLFALHPLVEVRAEAGIQPMFDNVGDYFYWGTTAPVYSAWSMAGGPDPDSLRAAERGFMPDRERYLQLPPLPDRIHALADSLTRGLETRYDRAAAIQQYLRSEFTYTRELPNSAREATLDHFLFERKAGHCEYYSTAMVVLLRSLGIHARNVNGFLGGRWNEFGGYLAVTQNEAHSWVEVWFPNFGWVAFDPTPGGSATGGTGRGGTGRAGSGSTAFNTVGTSGSWTTPWMPSLGSSTGPGAGSPASRTWARVVGDDSPFGSGPSWRSPRRQWPSSVSAAAAPLPAPSPGATWPWYAPRGRPVWSRGRSRRCIWPGPSGSGRRKRERRRAGPWNSTLEPDSAVGSSIPTKPGTTGEPSGTHAGSFGEGRHTLRLGKPPPGGRRRPRRGPGSPPPPGAAGLG